jgi:hypothetical protein
MCAEKPRTGGLSCNVNPRLRPKRRLHAAAWAAPPCGSSQKPTQPSRRRPEPADFSDRKHLQISPLGNFLKILHRQDSISGGQLPIMGHRLPTRSPALWCLGSHQADASRNGKPDESRGRKAIGPSVRFPPDHGSLVPEMKRRPAVLLFTHGSPTSQRSPGTPDRPAPIVACGSGTAGRHQPPARRSTTGTGEGNAAMPLVHAPASRIEADGANPPPRGE